MANIFLNLPMPVGDGPGPSVDTSAMGKEKSMVIGGLFEGTSVDVEVSTDGVVFQPFWSFTTAASKKVLPVAARFMRVYVRGRSSEPFSASVNVGANDAGALFASLPLPAGEGAGAPVNVSALGNFTTFVIGGPFQGTSVEVQASEDGVDFFPCVSFGDGRADQQSKIVVADFFRTFVRFSESVGSFAPIVSVGAVNDGGGGAGADELVKASPTDTTAGMLDTKLTAGSGVALTLLNPTADESVEIKVSGANAGDIVTGTPSTVRGDTNLEGADVPLSRTDHRHRLEVEVEDEGALAGARPAINFVGVGVGAVDDILNDRVNITIPGTPSDGTVVKRFQYVDTLSTTSGSSYVDGMTGTSIPVPVDGNYEARWEGEFSNSNAGAVLEVGVSVNSLVAVVAKSPRGTQGNANDVGAFITTVDLGALVAGDMVRGLFKKASGPLSVSIIRRNLTITKYQ